ncbi:hypothetical protein [Parablautia sp. Marseille-Q6255]|uniref:hypothetical protein n=1 Tax=Parablautia sp. Marseille-Q6255 TaxID=3039593 RepID=UPI0024BC03ED|nr:hypothetical protein [Parablautia sp. Marseille-Q6255]
MKQIKRYLWGILSMMFVCWVFLNTHMIHEVQASGYDTTAPKLNGVTLDKAEIILPGVVNVTLDITEEETGVESVFIQLNYVKENGEWVNNVCRMVQYTSGVDGGALFTGKHTFSIAMPSKIPAGTYVVYVSLNDGQQNRAEYCGVEEPHGDEQGNIVSVGRPLILQNVNGKEDDRCPLNTFLTAKSEFDVAFQNGIENPKLYDNLKQMNNNATAMVNYTTSSHIAPEQFFEAIKQTGKTLVFSDNEVQWVFRGNDIINPLKAVDLSVKIREVDGSVYGNDNRVLQLDFAENGLLPGKARIRLKSDYIYTLFSLKEPVRLY